MEKGRGSDKDANLTTHRDSGHPVSQSQDHVREDDDFKESQDKNNRNLSNSSPHRNYQENRKWRYLG